MGSILTFTRYSGIYYRVNLVLDLPEAYSANVHVSRYRHDPSYTCGSCGRQTPTRITRRQEQAARIYQDYQIDNITFGDKIDITILDQMNMPCSHIWLCASKKGFTVMKSKSHMLDGIHVGKLPQYPLQLVNKDKTMPTVSSVLVQLPIVDGIHYSYLQEFQIKAILNEYSQSDGTVDMEGFKRALKLANRKAKQKLQKFIDRVIESPQELLAVREAEEIIKSTL